MNHFSSPEPMSLGSPTQSPLPLQHGGVGGGGGSSGGVGQYLPQFLLGDLPNPQSQMNTRGSNQANSKYWPGSSNSPPRNPYYQNMQASSLSRSYSQNAYDNKSNNSNLIGDKADSNPYSSHYHHQSPYQSNYSPHLGGASNHQDGRGANNNAGPNSQISSNSKFDTKQMAGAPPVNRLIDMLNKPTFGAGSNNSSGILTPNESRNAKLNNTNDYYNSENRSMNHNQQDLSFTPGSNVMNPQFRMSPASPTQIDPFYAYGDSIKVDDKMDETWITVFGFPTSATSYVLQEFSNYGQILRHFPSNQGNWLHIQYQTKLQAQKALSKNGKVLANSLMVGVMQCIDKKIMTTNNNSINNSLDTTDVSLGGGLVTGGVGGGGGGTENGPLSPASATSARIAKSFTQPASKLDRTQSMRTSVRPLGNFNRNLDHGYVTTDSMHAPGHKLPKKSTNVISKAMEYMFGW
jgi:nuclear pore complex protein Nup53